MKSYGLSLICAVFLICSCTRGPTVDPKTIVTVLTYSSLGDKRGFLAKAKIDFEAQTECKLEVETTLGAAQVLSYLEEPRQQARIDVVMGLDEVLFARAKIYLYPASPVQAQYAPLIQPHATGGFYPTDYSALSMIYKKAEFGPGKLPVPKKMTDLLLPALRKKFIIQDPRISSPGMQFFLFADQLVKTQDLSKQWLAIAPSWTTSYEMFMAGEAPMVWSYLTSIAYHASKGQGADYAYVDFAEGLPLQVEGMAVVQKSGDPYEAKPCLKKWVEFVLKPVSQTELAKLQFMLPAVSGSEIPKDLAMVPVPKKAAALNLSLDRVDYIVSHFGRDAEH